MNITKDELKQLRKKEIILGKIKEYFITKNGMCKTAFLSIYEGVEK